MPHLRTIPPLLLLGVVATGGFGVFVNGTASAQADVEMTAETEAVPEEAGPTPEQIERARNHFNSGRSYYEEERFEAAAREFSETYRITGHPDVLFNLASCYDRMERYPQAIDTYRQYLRDHNEVSDRSRIERRIRELDALSRLSEQESTQTQHTDPPPPPPEPQDESPALMIAGWSLVGVGVVIGVAAVATGAVAQGEFDDLEVCTQAHPTCGQAADTFDERLDDGESLRNWSNTLTAVALGSGLIGLSLILIDLLTSPSDPESPLSVGSGPGDFGVSLTGDF